jgi:ChaB
MPRSSRYRPSAAGELPGTLQRSCQEAQAAFVKAHEDAVRAYGEGDEAYRAAYAALKRGFEKRGDQWIAKAESAA